MRIAAITLLPFLFQGTTPPQPPTDAILRLEDILAARGATPAPTPTPAATPRGPRHLMIEMPNLEAWKKPPAPDATPTATPTPIPGLPKLANLAPGNPGEVRFGERALLDEKAIVPEMRDSGRSQIVITNKFEKVFVKYTITHEGTDEPPIVLLHPPGFTETVTVPSGEYSITREAWMAPTRERFVTAEFPAQPLKQSFGYAIEGTPEIERRLIRAIELAP